MTGFSERTRRIIFSRSEVAGVPTCEIQVRCLRAPAVQIHHRRPRGMGGSKRVETNSPSNGLAACERCHSHVESHRLEALEHGWVVPQHQDPRIKPVLVRGFKVYLDDDGQKLGNPFTDEIQPLTDGVTNV